MALHEYHLKPAWLPTETHHFFAKNRAVGNISRRVEEGELQSGGAGGAGGKHKEEELLAMTASSMYSHITTFAKDK